jgi:hypothetical protein
MNATPPEARSQYSRGIPAFAATRAAPILLALIGSGLLIVAEFTRLYSVTLITSTAPAQTVSAGAHNAYALIPIGLLAAALALGPGRARNRSAALAAFGALAALGLLALAIVLLGDRPDTHTTGLTHHGVLAGTQPGPGLYLEALGALMTLAAGGLGVLYARTAHYTGPGAAAGQSSPSQM